MRAEQIDLPVSVRSEVGKSASHRLRATGRIPGVVYGRDEGSVAVAVDESLFRERVPEAHRYTSLIRLQIEGGDTDSAQPTVMIKEVQRDMVARRLLSIDFIRVSLDENVHAQIPVVAIGESPGIKLGGILDHISHEVTVECLPTEMPDHIEADISGLDIGDSLRVRDLPVPPDASMVSPADGVVIVIAPPVKVEEVAPEVEEVEGAVVEEKAEPEVIGEAEGEQTESA